MSKLKPEILTNLSKKLELSKNSVRQYISRERTKHPKATLNAAAQLFALSNKTTVLRMLDKEDRATLPSNIEMAKEKVIIENKKRGKKEKKMQILVDYETTEHFKKGHIHELNKTYTSGCNTAVFILGRKIVENLIIDILKKKYPEKIKANKELYFDTAQGRLKDFEVILKNLKSKKSDFGSENKAVERLCDLAKVLKDDANNKTHSWYHLVENKKEVENLNLKAIIEIIKKLEKEVGIR
ncbi:MAG: hypothetical protein UT90_C0004G0075 [Parcubacteria group bacterium GW2011_GWA1_40_21]|nr:MAG: hypothetical protein UT90_C0004G0075 [Parcubacteria group bacterium GW2011_GWA1_40_21]